MAIIYSINLSGWPLNVNYILFPNKTLVKFRFPFFNQDHWPQIRLGRTQFHVFIHDTINNAQECKV